MTGPDRALCARNRIRDDRSPLSRRPKEPRMAGQRARPDGGTEEPAILAAKGPIHVARDTYAISISSPLATTRIIE